MAEAKNFGQALKIFWEKKRKEQAEKEKNKSAR